METAVSGQFRRKAVLNIGGQMGTGDAPGGEYLLIPTTAALEVEGLL